MVWRIFTFWGKKSLFFAESFQKLSTSFYFIYFQFCSNLLSKCFIFIWWSKKNSFLFDYNRVFFQTFDKKILENEVQNWSQKRTQKWRKIEHNLDPKIITEKNHNSEVIQIIGTFTYEPNTARKLRSLTTQFNSFFF